MTSPEWSDYVLGQFASHELVDGAPNVAGLRRVTRKLLGPIVCSRGFVSQAPVVDGDRMTHPATAEYEVTVLWMRPDELQGREVVYRDCAETWPENCQHATAVKFPIETATTRAEARCLRKLLGLQAIAAEEKIYTDGEEMKISSQQILFIDRHCEKMSISVPLFVNAGQYKYQCIEDVPHRTAVIMTEKLGAYERDRDSIPARLRGYNAAWRQSFSRET